MLLTTRDTLPAETKTELQRLRPGRIVVLGGTGAVSNAVAAALSSVAPVERIAGINRHRQTLEPGRLAEGGVHCQETPIPIDESKADRKHVEESLEIGRFGRSFGSLRIE